MSAARPTVEFWYGDKQRFGHRGNPQPLLNIVGHVNASEDVAYLFYRVNGGRRRPLAMGVDLHRLSQPGAFNVEIPRAELDEGSHTVVVGGRSLAGEHFESSMKLEYAAGRRWPLPYEIDWSEVREIQDVADVVDGKWRLTTDGVRTLDPYYDRVIAIGDKTWTDYEARVDVTYHRVLADPGSRNTQGPPYLDHAHASLALRWAGHPDDGWRPRRDWQNLGAIVMLRSDIGQDGARWWIHLGRTRAGQTNQHWDHKRTAIELGRPYTYRMRVETTAAGGARYSSKVWRSDGTEPADWDVACEDPTEPVDAGALLLVVHHADVTFGDIEVVPID